MKKKARYQFGSLLFFILSVIIINFSKVSFLLFPSQEEVLKGKLEVGALAKDFLVIQEITAKKEYFQGVEILLTSAIVNRLNQGTLMITDSRYNNLYTTNFTNENLYEPQYLFFKLPEKVRVGRGKKLYVCLFSTTSDKDNYIGVPRNPSGKIGPLYVKRVIDNSIVSTLKSASPAFLLEGGLGIRVYESNYGFVNGGKIFLLFLAGAVALLWLYAENIKARVRKLKFVPEKIYVVVAFVFGLVMVFLTPPLQTPDEHDHLNRVYQVSEGNIFQFQSTVPSSLVGLFDAFESMNFHSYEKTSLSEIIEQTKVELNPHIRTPIFARNFTLSYMPQALGIFAGRMLNRSPVELLYLGRLFNLIVSIILIFSAIRTTPVLKWTLFLLGLMPMTIFLCASLSKDAMLIGASFLLFALFLRGAYSAQDNVSVKSLLLIFGLSFLLTSGRPVYGIIVGLFFLIPISKIGSWKKYVMVFAALVMTVLLAAQSTSVVNAIKQKQQAAIVAGSGDNTQYEDFRREGRVTFPENVSRDAQRRFILENPVQYGQILFNTLTYYGHFYLESFVGILGWLNKPLPGWLITLYLFMLLITAILLGNQGIKISWRDKVVAAVLFVGGVVLIETGLYLTWTPVGQDYIEGVQGRYFIPLAPVLFLIFYSRFFGQFSPDRPQAPQSKKSVAAKGKSLPAFERPAIYNFLYLLISFFCLVSLFISVYVVLKGYYVLTV